MKFIKIVRPDYSSLYILDPRIRRVYMPGTKVECYPGRPMFAYKHDSFLDCSNQLRDSVFEFTMSRPCRVVVVEAHSKDISQRIPHAYAKWLEEADDGYKGYDTDRHYQMYYPFVKDPSFSEIDSDSIEVGLTRLEVLYEITPACFIQYPLKKN